MSHTIAYKDTETDEILGYNRGNIWITRPEYNSFEVDGSMWMEVGTDIAHEMASSSEEVLSIWRDYQYQLYYHLSQTLAKKWKKEFILYPGIGFISEKHRKRPTNTLAIGQYMAVSAMPKHFCATHGVRTFHHKFAPRSTLKRLYLSLQITVHKQRKVLLEMVDGKFLQELAYIPYKDILLKLNGKTGLWGSKGRNFDFWKCATWILITFKFMQTEFCSNTCY